MEATQLAAPESSWTIQPESFAETVTEGFPLFRAHAAEIGIDKFPIPHVPALNDYAQMERLGLMQWLTVRDPMGDMIGYAMCIFSPSSIFSGKVHACLEWIYVRPEHRSLAIASSLIRECEAEFARRHAASASISIWAERDFGPLLKRLGWAPLQTTYWKFLTE